MLLRLPEVSKTLDEQLYLLKMLNIRFKENQDMRMDAMSQPLAEFSEDTYTVELKKTDQTRSGWFKHFTTRSEKPIPKTSTMFYFEVTVPRAAAEDEIVIGLAERDLPTDQKPGQTWKGGQSFGYNSLGGIWNRNVKLFDIAGYQAGDTIGLGVNMIKKELFFTRNGAFITKIIQLTNLYDYYPTVSLNSAHSQVRVNFGREPFFFNFEVYVQHELACLLKHIAESSVDKKELHMLVQQYAYSQGMNKTYEAMTRCFDLKPLIQPKTTITITPVSDTAGPATKATSVFAENKHQYDIDVNFSPTSGQNKNAKSNSSRATRCSLGNNSTDKTFYSQRCLLRGLIMEGRFAEAERVLGLCFPEVSARPEVAILFKVHRFISMLQQEPSVAAKFAQTFFTPEVRVQTFLHYAADGQLLYLQIKDLMGLFTNPTKPVGRLSTILDKSQRELLFDLTNHLILELLNIPTKSHLEVLLSHMGVLSRANIELDRGFHSVFPERLSTYIN